MHAFPRITFNPPGNPVFDEPGLTKREFAALSAMTSVLPEIYRRYHGFQQPTTDYIEEIAQVCVDVGDAVLVAANLP